MRDRIREGLTRKPTLLNAWLALGAPLAGEIVGKAGFDLATIDQQHGLGGEGELPTMMMAVRAGGLPVLVRVAANEDGRIGRALDLGAQGVICPMVNNVGDARRLASAVKYPPMGARSSGPIRASLTVEGDYGPGANEWTIAAAQIETAEAIDNLDAILSTKGIDMVYVGPNDLTISLSNGTSRDINGKRTLAAIEKVRVACKRHDVIAGIYANDADYARPLIAAGWQVVAVGSDARWLATGARAVVDLAEPGAAKAPQGPY